MSNCSRARRIIVLLAFCLAASAIAWGTHTERDESGHVVSLPDHVQRVVSLSPNLTNTVYALGAQSQLAGITDYTVYPPQAAREKPSVGGVVNPSLEKIVSLRPDVVLAVASFNGTDTISAIERLGIPVFLFNIGTLADIYRTVSDAGRVFGREQQAKELIASLHAREDKVRSAAVGQKRPSVLLVYSVDPFITAGNKSFVTEMIGLAGARSVTADIAQDWLEMNVEAVLPRDPNYLLLMKDASFSLKDLQHRAGWSSLTAVRNGRVLTLDDRIQLPAPVAFDALEDLAREIHAAESH